MLIIQVGSIVNCTSLANTTNDTIYSDHHRLADHLQCSMSEVHCAPKPVLIVLVALMHSIFCLIVSPLCRSRGLAFNPSPVHLIKSVSPLHICLCLCSNHVLFAFVSTESVNMVACVFDRCLDGTIRPTCHITTTFVTCQYN